MKVRLIRSWTNDQGDKYPIGTKLDLFMPFAKQLISEGICVEDKDYDPRKKKFKTDFFKNKN